MSGNNNSEAQSIECVVIIYNYFLNFRRLHPELSFFQQATDYPLPIVVYSCGTKRLNRRVGMHFLNSANVVRKGLGIVKISQKSEQTSTSEFKPLEEGSEAHWEVVERILFVYCKLNPGQGYVQGMNEIIGPIYYCFATDPIIKMKGKILNFILPIYVCVSYPH